MSTIEARRARGASDELRLLFCIPTLGHGGTERRIALLASELAKRGHDVHVATLRRGPNSDALSLDADRTHELPARGNYDPRIAVLLWKLARAHDVDLLQTCLLQMDVLGGLAARLAARPFVMTEPSCREAYTPSWKNRLRTRAAASAAAIVANSEGGAALWRDALPDKPCHVVRNGLALTQIAAAEPAPLVAFGTDELPLVLFVGRFDPAKNLETLVQGLAIAARERSFGAMLCGDGPLQAGIARRVEALGSSSRIEVPGPVSTPWSLMKRAAVFVSVSHFEGQPNAVLEAMACGTPLVVSDIPAHREVLDEDCAVFVAPRDPAAIARGICAVLADPTGAARRAAEALRRVEPLTVAAMADGYERIYRATVAGRSSERKRRGPARPTSGPDGRGRQGKSPPGLAARRA